MYNKKYGIWCTIAYENTWDLQENKRVVYGTACSE